MRAAEMNSHHPLLPPRAFSPPLRTWLAPGPLLALMLAASTLIHVFAYWGAPDLQRMLPEKSEPSYDAVLITPSASTAATDSQTPISTPQSKPKPAKPKVARAVSKPAPIVEARPITTEATTAVAVAEATAMVSEPEPIAVAAPIEETAPRKPNEPDMTPRVADAPSLAAPLASTGNTQAETSPVLPDFPSRISIGYRMTSSVADGVATIVWKRDGSRYEIDSTVQPSGVFTSMFVGTFRQISRGELTGNGIRPSYFSLKRGESREDTAEFLRDSNQLKIRKNGETHLMPLTDRLQDMQSFVFQMAHEMAKAQGAADTLVVQVTNARKVYEYRFKRVGEETLETRGGTMTAIHFKSDQTNPEDVYEVWLAPDRYFMPVKLKYHMGRFPVEQTLDSLKSSSASNTK
jgi:hypothetical protein